MHRDRLCLLQISNGDGVAHLVQFPNKDSYICPNLSKILLDEKILKIFHFARFDIAAIDKYLGIKIQNIFCTKIASRLTRTYTDYHGLKDLCSELLAISISKAQQCSNWSKPDLSDAQLKYAAQDVLYLHDLREKLLENLINLDRLAIAEKCFDFLPMRSEMDLKGFEHLDIFAH